MYQNFINTLLAIIAALALAAQLNYLAPPQPVDRDPWPSIMYTVEHSS